MKCVKVYDSNKLITNLNSRVRLQHLILTVADGNMHLAGCRC